MCDYACLGVYVCMCARVHVCKCVYHNHDPGTIHTDEINELVYKHKTEH